MLVLSTRLKDYNRNQYSYVITSWKQLIVLVLFYLFTLRVFFSAMLWNKYTRLEQFFFSFHSAKHRKKLNEQQIHTTKKKRIEWIILPFSANTRTNHHNEQWAPAVYMMLHRFPLHKTVIPTNTQLCLACARIVVFLWSFRSALLFLFCRNA